MPYITSAQSVASYVMAAYDPAITGISSLPNSASGSYVTDLLIRLPHDRQKRRYHPGMRVPRRYGPSHDRLRGCGEALGVEVKLVSEQFKY